MKDLLIAACISGAVVAFVLSLVADLCEPDREIPYGGIEDWFGDDDRWLDD